MKKLIILALTAIALNANSCNYYIKQVAKNVTKYNKAYDLNTGLEEHFARVAVLNANFALVDCAEGSYNFKYAQDAKAVMIEKYEDRSE